MHEIKAGVTLMQDFCRPNTDTYKGYIDYLDRDEAQRNTAIKEFNLFNDYMGNPEKSTGLFTSDKDALTLQEKKALKEVFGIAQENESIMWQTVISFDNLWLENNGVYDSSGKLIDERKLKEVTRLAINRLMKNEGLEHAVWSAGIHYNTDNIHIHVATVEPYPMREKMLYKGNYEVRGKFKLKNLEMCKSSVVNEIMQTRNINLKINQIIRKDIVESMRGRKFATDPALRQQFLNLYESIPNIPRNLVNYNNNIMQPYRETIDSISKKYLEEYHSDKYHELVHILDQQSNLYREAYGTSHNDYRITKEHDLMERMGNAILKSVKDYEKNLELKLTLLERKERKKELGLTKINEKQSWREEQDFLKLNKSSKDVISQEDDKLDIMYDPDPDIEAKNIVEFLEKNQKNASSYEAKNNVGGLDKEYNKHFSGLKYLEQAAQHGNGFAQYRLGRLYTDSNLECYDLKKGLGYLEQSAEQENEYAQYRLGKLYTDPNLECYDLKTGLEYLEKAMQQGNMYAAYQTGKVYLNPDTKFSDIKKGIKCLQDSMGQGNEQAKYLLGCVYLDKNSGAFNKEIGMKYMQELAEGGNEYAQVKMGFEYLKGENVQRNLWAAQMWFSKAAEQGNELAINMLEDINTVSNKVRRGGELDKALAALQRSMHKEEMEALQNAREFEYRQEQELDLMEF